MWIKIAVLKWNEYGVYYKNKGHKTIFLAIEIQIKTCFFCYLSIKNNNSFEPMIN